MSENDSKGLSPVAGDYLANMKPVYIGLIATCAALTLVTVGIYLSQLVFIYKYLGNWTLRFHAGFLLSIYPVYSLLSMVTMFVPRAMPINDMVCGIYISVCLYVFVRLIAGHFGGTVVMFDRLKGEAMPLRSPPICCCLFCLPTLTVSRKIIIILEIAVLQYGVFRPILAYSQAVIMAEKLEDFDTNTIFSRGILLITSTMTAMYGLQLLYRVCLQPLQHIPLRAKFICLQMVLLIDNIQSSLFLTLGSNDVLPADDGLTSQMNGYRIHRMITVVEMLLLAIVARIYYRRHMRGLIRSASSATLPRQDSICSTAPIISLDTNGQPIWDLPNRDLYTNGVNNRGVASNGVINMGVLSIEPEETSLGVSSTPCPNGIQEGGPCVRNGLSPAKEDSSNGGLQLRLDGGELVSSAAVTISRDSDGKQTEETTEGTQNLGEGLDVSSVSVGISDETHEFY